MMKKKAQKGHFKIILGAAPGVGKTYRMLQEARTLKKLGVDIVVGYIQHHGRQDTEDLLYGLEAIAPKKMIHKNITLEEMDTIAILSRSPHVVLVDELAHTNAPGSTHAKRYQDIEDLLKAGIAVITTLNIQHIESLNTVVEKITGIHVHERIPDSVLHMANEIVLADISVEELQDRLVKGKIYRKDKIEQALTHFFKKGNLVALRELALRELANTVETHAENDMFVSQNTVTGVHERILVCISTHKDAQRLIRRGFRIADRMCGELIVLYIHTEQVRLPKDALTHLESHKELTSLLNGHFLEVHAPCIVDAIVKVASEKKITQIIVGQTLRTPGFFTFFKPPIPIQILKKTKNLDMYIVGFR